MEFVGQPSPSGACNLLGVPVFSSLDVDDDECEVVIGIRPKSSPLPRRKSSVSEEDSEPEPPPSGSRRVSFADAMGLNLVQVKEFDTWDIPKLPECDSSKGEGKATEEYFISSLTFSLPSSTEELLVKVQEQKVELETIELLPGTTILRGVIRVLNISFNKAIYVRTSLDAWSSYFDLLAEYMYGSSDSLTDRFSFKLTLVPPFEQQGVRVDFCLRYETPVGTFWANNEDRNYVLFCHQRVEKRKEAPQKEKMNKKSCLKIVGQNFSAGENISATGASFQEKNSTDVSEHGENVSTTKVKQISDGQSGTSEENHQKLLAENTQICSQRSRRKAARMARVSDYISQRNGGVDLPERDKSLPEAKQTAQEEMDKDQHTDVQSCPQGSGESKSSYFVSESLETCSEPDMSSPAHDCTVTNSKTEKCESISVVDSATFTGDESAKNILDYSSNDELAPAECQNVNQSVLDAEPAEPAEPADNVTEAVSNECPVSQTSSFTFGTVMAPLYHQVFGRVGSESDWGNPTHVTLYAEELTQSYPYTKRGQTSFTVPISAKSNDDKVQGNVIVTPKSNPECFEAAPNSSPVEEEEPSLSLTANNILDHAEILQDAHETVNSDQRCICALGDTLAHPHTVNILNTISFNPQIPSESSHSQEVAKEDNLTRKLQFTQTDLDKTLSQTQDVMTSLETSFMSLQPPQSTSEQVSDEAETYKDGKIITISTTNAISEEGKPSESLHNLNSKHVNNSCVKEMENIHVSCFEIVEENYVPTSQIPLKNNNVAEGNTVMNNLVTEKTKHSAEMNVIGGTAESMTKAAASNHVHNDMQKTEHHEMEATLAKQEDFHSADIAEVNWEMMVEEEEKDILTDEEESWSSSKTVEKDQGQVEELRMETASENRDTTETEKEDEMVWRITAAREKQDEDADVYKQMNGEEKICDIVAGKDVEEVKKGLEYFQATQITEEIVKKEEQEERVLKREQHGPEIQEVNTEETNIEKEIDGEEEVETHLNDYDEAGVEWEYQVNTEGENPNYKREILVDETEESKTVDVQSENVIIEDRDTEEGCSEENIIQNKTGDGLSAPMNNVHHKRITEKGNGHISTEMHLRKKEDFLENATYDLLNPVRDESESTAAEGRSCIFADEPESDQTSHDSASAESDSDDELELYMHCLRAIHTGAQAQKEGNKDAVFNVGKRPSVSRSKLLSTPMPSISESLDEEHLSQPQDDHEDAKMTEVQPTAAALPALSREEDISQNVSAWKDTFSCSNISKTLLYSTLFMVFLVVAYHYDFLACFGLYLIAVVWLYCQGERPPEHKDNNRID